MNDFDSPDASDDAEGAGNIGDERRNLRARPRADVDPEDRHRDRTKAADEERSIIGESEGHLVRLDLRHRQRVAALDGVERSQPALVARGGELAVPREGEPGDAHSFG